MVSNNVNFLKNWNLSIFDTISGKKILEEKSSTISSNVMALQFLIYPFSGIGYPSWATIRCYNFSQTQENLFKEGQAVQFSVGLGAVSTTIFKGILKAFWGVYDKPDYIFEFYCLGLANDDQYNLTKQMVTIDIPKGSITETSRSLANALAIPVVNIYGVDGTTLVPPLKIVAKNFYNAMDLYSNTAQVSYSYDHLKNFLNIYPNHKVNNQNFIETPPANKIKLVDDVIGYPSVDVGTQNMSCTKLITNNIIYFRDVVKINLNLLAFNNVIGAPDQKLVERNQNANFFIHTISFSGDTRIGSNATWVQQIYGVAQS